MELSRGNVLIIIFKDHSGGISEHGQDSPGLKVFREISALDCVGTNRNLSKNTRRT